MRYLIKTLAVEANFLNCSPQICNSECNLIQESHLLLPISVALMAASFLVLELAALLLLAMSVWFPEFWIRSWCTIQCRVWGGSRSALCLCLESELLLRCFCTEDEAGAGKPHTVPGAKSCLGPCLCYGEGAVQRGRLSREGFCKSLLHTLGCETCPACKSP